MKIRTSDEYFEHSPCKNCIWLKKADSQHATCMRECKELENKGFVVKKTKEVYILNA